MRAHFKCSRRERLSLFRGCLHLVRVAVALETLGIRGGSHRAMALMFLVAGCAGTGVYDIGLMKRMTRMTLFAALVDGVVRKFQRCLRDYFARCFMALPAIAGELGVMLRDRARVIHRVRSGEVKISHGRAANNAHR